MAIMRWRAETVWPAAPSGITVLAASDAAFPSMERPLILGCMMILGNFQARVDRRAEGKRDATALGKSRDKGAFPIVTVFARDDGRAVVIRHRAFELAFKQRDGFFMLVDHAGEEIGHDDGPHMLKTKLLDQLLVQSQ